MRQKKKRRRKKVKAFRPEFMLAPCKRCGHTMVLRLSDVQETGAGICKACGYVNSIDELPPLRRARVSCPCCETVSDYWIMDGGEVVSYRCRNCKAPVDAYWDKGAQIYRGAE